MIGSLSLVNVVVFSHYLYFPLNVVVELLDLNQVIFRSRRVSVGDLIVLQRW